ncbi:hypothetical protein GGI07_005808 [Coemansia sp. Benny D115]|nr:hypothetical protein GGI07_005808 [Coemansia sp. Benny D115]
MNDEATATYRRREMKENIDEISRLVTETLAAAVTAGSRAGADARLVAVSKYKPASDIQAAYDAGQRHFGENYVKELLEKAPQLPSDIKWHFIGNLQRNKCKMLAAIPNLWAVETIDSEAKARTMDAAWSSAGHAAPLNVFIQVNTSAEQSKGGVEADSVVQVAKAVHNSCPSLRLLGLMTIGSVEGSHTRPNPDFLALAQLRDQVNAELGVAGLELSMGMSGDFEHALEIGSTNVRVGSRLFGSRPKKN